MRNMMPWIIIAVLFVFAFIYAPLRSGRTTPATPSERHKMAAAAVGAVLVAVAVYCFKALR